MWGRRSVRFVLAWACVALIAVGCSSAPAGLGSRADAVAFFNSLGFTGTDAPLADGTARWTGKGPEDSLAEVVGSNTPIDRVSLSVDGQGVGGDLLDAFLKHFAPGSGSFLGLVLNATASGNQDQTRVIGGRTVHIQTQATADSYLIGITVS